MTQDLRKNIGFVLLLCGGFMAVDGVAWAQGFGQTGFGGTSGRRSSTSGNYPSSTEVGTATFSTDPETRKLVVVTDEETAKYISLVVSNLDRPPPQVLIKVVFLEVTHRKGSDIGVEGAYSKNLGNSTAGNLLQNFQALPGLDAGDALFNVAGSDFEVTLRAIAQAGKLEVLSRPTILARNNQQAYINVGQRVPLITATRYDTFGNQINSITYQDVGIILQVTPFITSDGMVEMIVSPEISNLSEETVATSTGTNSTGLPVINTRSADTVVVTPDGQTVVIGGLMQNTKTETVSKVPVLGDIPLLGAAFRRKVKGDSKTELLIFLTPHIIRQPAELAALSNAEKANTQLAPKSFSEEDLNRFFDTLPQKENGVEPKTKRK
jgi:general secretion pathway protein D